MYAQQQNIYTVYRHMWPAECQWYTRILYCWSIMSKVSFVMEVVHNLYPVSARDITYTFSFNPLLQRDMVCKYSKNLDIVDFLGCLWCRSSFVLSQILFSIVGLSTKSLNCIGGIVNDLRICLASCFLFCQ